MSTTTMQLHRLPGHWFGRRPEQLDNVLAAWGSRAILSGRTPRDQWVDIVHDRTQAWTPEIGVVDSMLKLPRPFLAFLREKVTPWVHDRCGERFIDPGSRQVFTLLDGHLVAQASPQASFGYLYIGAWMLAAPETAP